MNIKETIKKFRLCSPKTLKEYESTIEEFKEAADNDRENGYILAVALFINQEFFENDLELSRKLFFDSRDLLEYVQELKNDCTIEENPKGFFSRSHYINRLIEDAMSEDEL